MFYGNFLAPLIPNSGAAAGPQRTDRPTASVLIFPSSRLRCLTIFQPLQIHRSDSRIFSAAARGFGAAQIGRPMTSQFAPASSASRALKVRF